MNINLLNFSLTWLIQSASALIQEKNKRNKEENKKDLMSKRLIESTIGLCSFDFFFFPKVLRDKDSKEKEKFTRKKKERTPLISAKRRKTNSNFLLSKIIY